MPAPDTLEFSLPEGHICLIVEDGTPTGLHLAQALAARHWPVAVLRLPGSPTSQPAALPHLVSIVTLADWSEAQLEARLAALSAERGPIGAVIHLHPAGTGEPFCAREKASLKHLFLLAKHLKRPLNAAAQRGHAGFLAVTRLDGQLGLGQAGMFGVIGGGVFGLTKTLALEWPAVFCRAVDLSPTFTPEQAVKTILAELFDPNRLIVEAGWSAQGRVTLNARP